MAVLNSNVTAIAARHPVVGAWGRRRARAAGVPVFTSLPGMPNALKPRVQFVKSGRPVTPASMPVATKLAPNGKPAVAPPKPLRVRSISPFGPSLDGMDGVDGVFDFVKDLVPSHTVVGKLLSGDVKGAAQGAVKEVAKLRAGSGQPTTQAGATGPVYYDAAAPAPQGSGFLVNKPLLFASLGLGALGVFLLVRSRR